MEHNKIINRVLDKKSDSEALTDDDRLVMRLARHHNLTIVEAHDLVHQINYRKSKIKERTK